MKEISTLSNELAHHSERHAAIVAGAYLDEKMRSLIEFYLIDNEKAQNDLVGNDTETPLSAFGARITAAYALGLIGKTERDDLRLIKNIRNRFAHEKDLSFQHPDVESRCQSLKLADTSAQRSEAIAKASNLKNPHTRFMLSVSLLDGMLGSLVLNIRDSVISLEAVRGISAQDSFHPNPSSTKTP